MKKWRLLLLMLPLIAGSFSLRSLASWRPKKVFVGQGAIDQLAFSSDGKHLLVMEKSGSQLVCLDASSSFSPLWSHQENSPHSAAQFFDSDSRVLLKANAPKILDAQTGQVLHEYSSQGFSGVAGQSSISPEGKWFASHQLDVNDNDRRIDRIRIDAASDQFAATWKAKTKKIIDTGKTDASSFAFSPDGKTFVARVSTPQSTTLEFYDTKSWKRTDTLLDNTGKTSPHNGHRRFSTGVQWSPDGRFLLSGWKMPTSSPMIKLVLWRISDKKKLDFALRSEWGDLPVFEVQNDGSIVEQWPSGFIHQSKPASLDVITKPLLSLPGERITAFTMSPDGSFLVVGTQSGLVYKQRAK